MTYIGKLYSGSVVIDGNKYYFSERYLMQVGKAIVNGESHEFTDEGVYIGPIES